MNRIILSASLTFILLSLAPAHAQECADLWAQCGGKGYTGPTCCEQPTPLPLYLTNLPSDSTVCKKVNTDFSQCVPRCSEDKPCLLQGRECQASFRGSSDGRGRQYCGEMTACTNPEWCFSNSLSCVCGGDVPCALTDRPGGCRAPSMSSVRLPGTDSCGGGARRCPAFQGEQCGGKGHEDPTTCQPGLKCVKYSKFYSGCQAE